MFTWMSFTRRRFLLLSVLSAVWAGVGRLFGQQAEVASESSDALSGWMDTLFPADGESPAASELQVHEQILAKALAIPGYHNLLKAGIRWAETQAVARGATSFAALDEADRETVVTQAEAMGHKVMPGLFFYHTLRDGRKFYYGHRESWAGVGLPHAPQPIGFLDYTEAPK